MNDRLFKESMRSRRKLDFINRFFDRLLSEHVRVERPRGPHVSKSKDRIVWWVYLDKLWYFYHRHYILTKNEILIS